MPVLDGLEKFAFPAFLVSTMLSLGMNTELSELRATLSARSALVRTLLANFVVAPLLALLIVRLIPLAPGPAAALVVLGCVPGGLSSVQFTRSIKGRESAAGAMVVVLCVLAVLVSPFLLRLVLPGLEDTSIPYGRVLGFYALFLLAPLAVGMALDSGVPKLAEKLKGVLGIASAVLFVTFMLSTKSFRAEAVASVGATAVVAMLAFILATMTAGWMLGGPHRDGRLMLASTTSMRNAALALAVARDAPSGAVVMPAVIAFSLLMVPPNTVLALWGRFRAHREAKASKPAGTARGR